MGDARKVSDLFESTPDGVLAHFSDAERDFLIQLLELLADVGSAAGDPAAARLDPVVYPDDPLAEEEYRRLMRSEIDEARVADRSAYQMVLESKGDVTMSFPEAEAVMRVVGEGRLALAARLGIRVEGDTETLDKDDRSALDYLAYVQGNLIEVLSTRLPSI